MATPKQTVNGTELSIRPSQTENENLPSLISRLGEDVMQLFDTKISLLKVEIKEEAREFARDSTMIAIGAVIATVGFALLNVAIAFGVSTLFANADLSQPAKYALGFVVTGIFYLIIGAVVISAMKKRLSKVDVVPQATVEELRKDKQWLKKGI
jgi:uncharacterized membrane protein YqjE